MFDINLAMIDTLLELHIIVFSKVAGNVIYSHIKKKFGVKNVNHVYFSIECY